jgi:hypothetical protein
MAWILGSKLSAALKRQALSLYVHRFTGNHRPAWSNGIWKDGLTYPLQFKDDEDWLANTSFPISEKGTFDKRAQYCSSNPTWPNNPELRRA